MPKAKKGSSKNKKKVDESSEIRGIVRIAGKDVRGHFPMYKALSHVKGVGRRYAKVISEIAASKLNTQVDAPIGSFSDEQLEAIENIMTHPLDYGVPEYMLNKRREFSSGEAKHLISNDLIFSLRQDVEKEMKIRSWRGISHMYRKKVRGQRTRTTGRRGSTLGVVRKKNQPGKK